MRIIIQGTSSWKWRFLYYYLQYLSLHFMLRFKPEVYWESCNKGGWQSLTEFPFKVWTVNLPILMKCWSLQMIRDLNFLFYELIGKRIEKFAVQGLRILFFFFEFMFIKRNCLNLNQSCFRNLCIAKNSDPFSLLLKPYFSP